jgi:hypothetical protein
MEILFLKFINALLFSEWVIVCFHNENKSSKMSKAALLTVNRTAKCYSESYHRRESKKAVIFPVDDAFSGLHTYSL